MKKFILYISLIVIPLISGWVIPKNQNYISGITLNPTYDINLYVSDDTIEYFKLSSSGNLIYTGSNNLSVKATLDNYDYTVTFVPFEGCYVYINNNYNRTLLIIHDVKFNYSSDVYLNRYLNYIIVVSCCFVVFNSFRRS